MTPLRHQNTTRPLDRVSLGIWRRSARGGQLIDLEARELARLLPDVFGRHVLQVGSWAGDTTLVDSAGTLHHAVLGALGDPAAAGVVDPQQLPLPAKSVDAIVLPHTLEFSRSPHNVLREVDRVLNDRGRLFVLGFNPWSVWSWRSRLGMRHRAFPTGANFYSVGRVVDWLELLDFEVGEVRRFSIGFPWSAPHSVGDGWSLASVLSPLAEAYLVCARKRVLPMNFVGRVARAQVRPMVGVGVPVAQRDVDSGLSH